MAEKKEYTPSEGVQAALAAAEAKNGAKPAQYQSAWEGQLQGILEQILNQKEFRYNLNGDALYQQYRDAAAQSGKRAMEDAMAQAAALTGGYGNSYAQSAGQQAYWNQMESLGDRIPELYALALDQYRQRSESLQNKYALLAGAEDRDYSRYQDSLSAWQKEADNLWKRYTDSRDFDYDSYRDQVSDWQWQENFDESKRRYDQEWDDTHTPKYSFLYVPTTQTQTSTKTQQTSTKTQQQTKTQQETEKKNTTSSTQNKIVHL